MTMTLKEVRNQIASLEGDDSRRKAWVAAIDAHIAGIGEPFGYMSRNMTPFRSATPAWQFTKQKVETHGCIEAFPVFTAPPIDIAAVREVIADLEKFSTSGRDVRLAAKLTAALPKEME